MNLTFSKEFLYSFQIFYIIYSPRNVRAGWCEGLVAVVVTRAGLGCVVAGDAGCRRLVGEVVQSQRRPLKGLLLFEV